MASLSAGLHLASKQFPVGGVIRLQARHHASPFKAPGGPINPKLAWLRANFPAVFGLGKTWRFTDERREFAETYAGTKLYDAAMETFDSFRVEAYTVHLASSVRRPGGALFSFQPGAIQREEIDRHDVLELRDPRGDFADVMDVRTQNWLSTIPKVAGLANKHFKTPVVDSGIITAPGPRARAVTHAISRAIFNVDPPLGGIRYSSRIGQGPENWAIFERSNPEWRTLKAADSMDPDIQQALHDLNLVLGP